MNTRLIRLLGILSVIALAQACTPSGDTPTVNADSTAAGLFQRSNVSGKTLGITGTKKIVLTFDDGPFPGVTNGVLDYLRDEGIKAEFFLVGKNVPGNENLLMRMRDEGHSIGNHTYDHKGLVGLGRKNMDLVYHEIADTDAKIAPFIRPDARVYFRAPGGTFNPKAGPITTLNMNAHPELRKYIGPVYWDIGGQVSYALSTGRPSPGNRPTQYLDTGADWECWEKNFVVATCAAAYFRETEKHQGGIVLMHDHDPRTLEMIKVLIPRWKQAGYSFILLDQISGIERLQ